MTRLCWDFLHAHLPQGARSKWTQKPNREREGAGRVGRRSHVAPRAGRHHVVPAAEECRERGTRTHTGAHTHTPGRDARPHPPSTPSAAAGAERRGRVATSSPRAGGAAHGTQLSPARRARPLPPPPPHAPRVAACPLNRLTFSANPFTGCPAHSPSGSLSRRKVPRIREGKHRIQ